MDSKKKAWVFDLDKIEEPWHYSDYVFYADTRNEARMKALEADRKQVLCLTDMDGNEFTYLNMPIKRDRWQDKQEYNGVLLHPERIKELEKRRLHQEHLQSILDDNTVSEVYIMKRGEYYRRNYCGYTSKRDEAGIYPKKDAVEHSYGVVEIKLVKAR